MHKLILHLLLKIYDITIDYPFNLDHPSQYRFETNSTFFSLNSSCTSIMVAV